MTAVQRPGWSKPYVGCMNWSSPNHPHAAVVYRGYSIHFDTWPEAIAYVDTEIRRHATARAARIARRQARDDG